MSPGIISSLRWTARICGSLMFCIVLALATGDGFPNPYTLVFGQQVMSLAMFVMLAGILVAWKWEGVGGGMLLSGYLMFLATESISRQSLAIFSFFDVFLLLGLLNIAVWRSARHSTARASHRWRRLV